jgi:microsomal epoxide hydrolase
MTSLQLFPTTASEISLSYSTLPPNALKIPSQLTVSIPDDQIADFQTLLKLSKIPAPTYKSTQADAKYGITGDWITEAKEY